jgi:hypothetical protein
MGTIFLAKNKSRQLESLAFDEKSIFDIFALFYQIKRGSLYPVKGSKNIKSRLFFVRLDLWNYILSFYRYNKGLNQGGP